MVTLWPCSLSRWPQLWASVPTHGAGDQGGSRLELADRLAELERQGKLLRATAADAHDLRRRDDAPGRLLLRHRELLAAHRRPRRRLGAALPARLLPRGLPAGHRRVARDRPADRRHVRGRHVPQAGPGRPRLPAAQRHGQPAAAAGRSSSTGSARPSTCRRRRGPTSWPRGRGGRADHPARPGWSTPRSSQADQGPDRRPARTRSGRGPSATSGSSSRP